MLPSLPDASGFNKLEKFPSVGALGAIVGVVCLAGLSCLVGGLKVRWVYLTHSRV